MTYTQTLKLLSRIRVRNITRNKALVERALQISGELDQLKYNPDYVFQNGSYYAAMIGDEVVGGYILVNRNYYRILELARALSGKEHDEVSIQNSVEIGGVWFDPKIKSRIVSGVMWLHMCLTIFTYRRRYIVYGVNASRTGLLNLYRKSGSTVMYCGPTAHAPFKTHPMLSCEYVEYKKFLPTIFKLFLIRLFTAKRERGHAKRYKKMGGSAT